ncbi:cupin domain-containing protein [Frondihabitans australicus]|uniref:cupin domain-containing protein n=1 Tax=Frondihabitans australicus TaxID=386892 RepID=UPI001FE983AA|nr:cupin domain-containing protein [Frondihabitans australicus]
MPGQVARRTVSGEVIEWLDVPARAEALGLEPHPEGGWYRRTWTSPITVPFGDSTRPGATLIHFLLPPGEASAWHRVESDEIWLWHGPDPLVLELGGHGESPVSPSDDESTQEQPDVFRILLGGGAGTLLGEAAQGLIPGGVWQRTLPSDGETLVSCVVSPGFSFDDFTLAE